MVSRVKVGSRPYVLALRVIALSDRIGRVAELDPLLPGPNDFAGGVYRLASFFDDFHKAVEPVVGKLRSSRESGVIDCDQPVRAVPLECARAAITGEAAIGIV